MHVNWITILFNSPSLLRFALRFVCVKITSFQTIFVCFCVFSFLNERFFLSHYHFSLSCTACFQHSSSKKCTFCWIFFSKLHYCYCFTNWKECFGLWLGKMVLFCWMPTNAFCAFNPNSHNIVEMKKRLKAKNSE